MDREAARRILEPELRGQERLLWTGRPRQGLFLQRSDKVRIPASLLVLAFALYWRQLTQESGKQFLVVVGWLVLAAALYQLFARFFVDAWRRSRTYYGLTTERALIVNQGVRRTVVTVEFERIETIAYREHAGRRGTITFGPEPPLIAYGERAFKLPPQFVHIEDGRAAHELLLANRRNPSTAPPEDEETGSQDGRATPKAGAMERR